MSGNIVSGCIKQYSGCDVVRLFLQDVNTGGRQVKSTWIFSVSFPNN